MEFLSLFNKQAVRPFVEENVELAKEFFFYKDKLHRAGFISLSNKIA